MRTFLATLVAGVIAGWSGPAWGHSFPARRSVVVQVEPCEVALLVGYSPPSGEATDLLLAKAAGAQKTRGAKAGTEALSELLTSAALAPLTLSVDGIPLVPTSARVKLSGQGSGERPTVVVLVTYALPAGGRLTLTSKDPRATRVTWSDKSGPPARSRVDHSAASAQGSWHSGVASFLLPMRAGVSQCAASSTASPRSSRSAR